MIDFVTDVQKIKHDILKEVAKLAYEGELIEHKDDICYKIIPKGKARFRCCIYREREIVRERARLAMGELPLVEEAKSAQDQVVHVIAEACEECPIHRYQVSENCQGCLAKKCQRSCNFDAISIIGRRAYIDYEKCRECGKCYEACPYNAITSTIRPCKKACNVDAITMDEDNKAVIDSSKCINCGACSKECPFGAISDISFIVPVIEKIKSAQRVFAIYAPAVEGQFGEHITSDAIEEGLRKLGFDEVYEVALGADAVALHEAHEVAQNLENNKLTTTSCCSAFVQMIGKHFPTLQKSMSTTVSPMGAVSRYLKNKEPGCCVVFIGPCIAKKVEVYRPQADNGPDYIITVEELAAMFEAKKIKLEDLGIESNEASAYGRQFALSGGVTGAVIKVLEEEKNEASLNPIKCNGALECKKVLLLAKSGKLPENFIEGMICCEGCVGGPGNIIKPIKAKNIIAKRAKESKYQTVSDVNEKMDFNTIKMDR